MSYFKRFGDTCSGISAFMALIYLFRTFMSTKATDEEMGIIERLKLFVSPTAAPDRYFLAILALMLVISALAGCIFARIPYITPLFSLPPLLLTLDMIKSQYIKDYPMLHLLLAIFAFLGGIYECSRMDRVDGKHRAATAANITAVFFSAFLIWLYRVAVRLEGFAGNELEDLNIFEREVLALAPDMNMGLLLVFAALSLLLVAISLILRDIYFIDAVMALPPVLVLIYLWGAEKITVQSEVVVAFSICVLAARIVPMFMGKAESKR